ncbi:hypothetical protein WN48_10188 [Eufriesea mexicana]|nr:hypothetical protein WN48_10188 [Eufriesea mexicana]
MQKEMGEGCQGDGSRRPTKKGRYDHVDVTDSFPRPKRGTGIPDSPGTFVYSLAEP